MAFLIEHKQAAGVEMTGVTGNGGKTFAPFTRLMRQKKESGK